MATLAARADEQPSNNDLGFLLNVLIYKLRRSYSKAHRTGGRRAQIILLAKMSICVRVTSAQLKKVSPSQGSLSVAMEGGVCETTSCAATQRDLAGGNKSPKLVRAEKASSACY